MASESQWATAVGRVSSGGVEVRGYPLAEIISQLTFSEAMYLTIRGELPSPNQVPVLDAALCSILEHAFYAPTTVAARVVTSATPDSIIPGLAAGMLTIGTVTVSPQQSAELIAEVRSLIDASRTLDEVVGQVVDEMIRSGRRMPGLGHPLHPSGDPRATALEAVARENGVWGGGGDVYHAVRERYLDAVGKKLPTNIDGMLGCVLTDLGFAPREMPGVAAMSFMPGLIAHTVEEADLPPRLRIADGAYTGPHDQPRHLNGARDLPH